MRTDFVLDALEQTLFDRKPERSYTLIHHSDRGSQYVSIFYTERLAEVNYYRQLADENEIECST